MGSLSKQSVRERIEKGNEPAPRNGNGRSPTSSLSKQAVADRIREQSKPPPKPDARETGRRAAETVFRVATPRDPETGQRQRGFQQDPGRKR